MKSSRPVSVSDLTRRIKVLLEGEIGEAWVEGEVSNARVSAAGHAYFVLKDADATLNAVCFRSALVRQGVHIEDGMTLEVRGSVSAYTPRSEYQINVRSMRPGGLGELMRRYLALKEKLAAEGLFDAARKRPIGRLPRRIGIVTSPTGAALRDILDVLGRRARGLEIVVSPAQVQGTAAPASIVEALERLQRHTPPPDVVIVGRGGGSIEDLWAFNDERVVRALAACPIPVISAVGHETDTTLADLAADLRAATPSAAAELVTAHYEELARQVTQHDARLRRAMGHVVADRRARLERCRASWGLRSPRERLAAAMQRLDDLTQGLMAAGPRRWRPQLDAARRMAEQMRARLDTAALGAHRRAGQRLRAAAERLDAASPDSILRRGYSIVTRGKAERVVTSPEQVRPNQVVHIRSAGGPWRAAVLRDEADLFDSAQ